MAHRAKIFTGSANVFDSLLVDSGEDEWEKKAQNFILSIFFERIDERSRDAKDQLARRGQVCDFFRDQSQGFVVLKGGSSTRPFDLIHPKCYQRDYHTDANMQARLRMHSAIYCS